MEDDTDFGERNGKKVLQGYPKSRRGPLIGARRGTRGFEAPVGLGIFTV